MNQVTKTNEMTLFVDDAGVGDVPVVFLHSLAGNAAQWTAQLTHLRQTRRALAVDLRGHGQSPHIEADHPYTIQSLAADVHHTLTALGVQKFILVGHSMGGSVAAAYAGTYPQDVVGLLLVDPSGDSTQMPAADVQQYLAALESDAYLPVIGGYWQQILTGSTAATQAQVMQDLNETAKITVVGGLKSLFTFNPKPMLDRYPGAKQIVFTPGTESPFSLHKIAPSLPQTAVMGTGHWLHMDKPDEFNQILDDFIASL